MLCQFWVPLHLLLATSSPWIIRYNSAGAAMLGGEKSLLPGEVGSVRVAHLGGGGANELVPALLDAVQLCLEGGFGAGRAGGLGRVDALFRAAGRDENALELRGVIY